MKLAARSVAAGVLACSAAVAAAAGWSVNLADGRRVSIVADSAAGDSAQFLERRLPDGSLDRQFGNAGRVVISLGADSPGPRSIREDSGGRLLVVGAAMGAEGRASPASMRYLADGRIDLSWGVQGRSLVQLQGADAIGADLLPMPDGSVLMLGQIEAETTEHAALWRLGANGAVDSGFGQGGVMRATGLGASEGLALQLDDDGAALIAVQTADQGLPWLEVHRWQIGQEQPQRVAQQPMPTDWLGPATLARRGGTWQWFDAAQPINSGGVPLLAVAATGVWSKGLPQGPTQTVATQASTGEGGAAWNPFSPEARAEAAATAGQSADFGGLAWGVLAGLALAALVGVAWWRWRWRRKA